MAAHIQAGGMLRASGNRPFPVPLAVYGQATAPSVFPLVKVGSAAHEQDHQSILYKQTAPSVPLSQISEKMPVPIAQPPRFYYPPLVYPLSTPAGPLPVAMGHMNQPFQTPSVPTGHVTFPTVPDPGCAVPPREVKPGKSHRVAQACERCRIRKIKCNEVQAMAPCDNCLRKGVECTYVPRANRQDRRLRNSYVQSGQPYLAPPAPYGLFTPAPSPESEGTEHFGPDGHRIVPRECHQQPLARRSRTYGEPEGIATSRAMSMPPGFRAGTGSSAFVSRSLSEPGPAVYAPPPDSATQASIEWHENPWVQFRPLGPVTPIDPNGNLLAGLAEPLPPNVFARRDSAQSVSSEYSVESYAGSDISMSPTSSTSATFSLPSPLEPDSTIGAPGGPCNRGTTKLSGDEPFQFTPRTATILRLRFYGDQLQVPGPFHEYNAVDPQLFNSKDSPPAQWLITSADSSSTIVPR